MLKKILGIRYVDINLSQDGKTYYIKMPYGEMKISLTTGMEEKNPQRIENSPYGLLLKEINICNTHFWSYNDFGKNWTFKNRSGTFATFDTGEIKIKLAI